MAGSSSNPRVLKVFLASPSDLAEERASAQTLVPKINSLLRDRLGAYIDLIVWEDERPRVGRPQSMINRHVGACDLFIGALWESWGQPTGEYSSGFEEEFQLALDSYQRSGRPDIALYFKRISHEQLQDPGPNVVRILRFKTAIKDAQQLLYNEFETVQDWQVSLDHRLIELAMTATTRVGVSTEDQSSTSRAATVGGRDLSAGEAPELQQALSRLDQIVGGSTPAGEPEGASYLGRFDALRVSLAASAQVHVHVQRLFDSHEMNALYQSRRQVHPSSLESFFLFRSVIADFPHLVTPGWYWFREGTDVEFRLCLAAAFVDAATIRSGALSLLAVAGIAPSSEAPKTLQVLTRCLRSDDASIRAAALSWLGRTGRRDDLAVAAKAFGVEPTDMVQHPEARDSAIEVLAREVPSQALSAVLETSSSIGEAPSRALLAAAKRLSVAGLARATAHPSPSVRTVGFEALASTNRLSRRLIRVGLGDSDKTVRQIVAAEVATRGHKDLVGIALEVASKQDSADWRRIRIDLLGLKSYETLKADLDWPHDEVYEALGMHWFPRRVTSIRAEIDNTFADLRAQFLDNLRGMGPNASEVVRSYEEQLTDFLNERLLAAALEVLAVKGGRADLKRARQYLRRADTRIQKACMQLLHRVGVPRDGQLILGAIGDFQWNVVSEAAEVAIDLISRGNWATARRKLRRLLDDENVAVRRSALRALVKRSTRADLESILDDYAGASRYFYNVTAGLDRALYAPAALGGI